MRTNVMEIISVAGIIGIGLIATAAFLALAGKDVPEWLAVAVGSIVTYFYSKTNGNGKSGGPPP